MDSERASGVCKDEANKKETIITFFKLTKSKDTARDI